MDGAKRTGHCSLSRVMDMHTHIVRVSESADKALCITLNKWYVITTVIIILG